MGKQEKVNLDEEEVNDRWLRTLRKKKGDEKDGKKKND